MDTEFRNKAAQHLKSLNAPERVNDSQLSDLCHALGWQGGTFHQVLAEVRQLATVRAKAKPGDRVRYTPGHAHGDTGHPDCEDGTVVTVREAITFVQFATGGPKACTPSDLVVLQSRE